MLQSCNIGFLCFTVEELKLYTVSYCIFLTFLFKASTPNCGVGASCVIRQKPTDQTLLKDFLEVRISNLQS